MATDHKDDITPFALGIGPPTIINPLKPETRSIISKNFFEVCRELVDGTACPKVSTIVIN
jgi:hypothetical protein